MPVIRRVLAATDFSRGGNDTIRHAYSLLPAGGALHVLHVCGAPSAGMDPLVASQVYFNNCLELEHQKDEAVQKFEEILPRQLATSDVVVTTEVMVDSHTAAAICRAADIFRADVICIGSRSHSATAAALLGSVTHEMLSKSSRPLMVVTPQKL